MHVVRHAADGLGYAVERTYHPAEVSVQPVSPGRRNEGFVVLRSENEMVVKAQMRG
jgi:hypothetical protein